MAMAFDMSSYLEEPGFTEIFCAGCKAMRQDPETGTWYCPAEGDISDPACRKYMNYEDCLKFLEDAGKELMERCVA